MYPLYLKVYRTFFTVFCLVPKLKVIPCGKFFILPCDASSLFIPPVPGARAYISLRKKAACVIGIIMYNTNMDENGKTFDILGAVRAAFDPGRAYACDPTQLGPLVLAYIGDTVYDLYVRSQLVLSTRLTAHGLHMAAAKQVCAAAQAESFKLIEPMLSEDELAVYKRGRNGHMGTIPKNASIGDYRAATGLEAVIGWLYLKGNDARINELMRVILSEERYRKEQ